MKIAPNVSRNCKHRSLGDSDESERGGGRVVTLREKANKHREVHNSTWPECWGVEIIWRRIHTPKLWFFVNISQLCPSQTQLKEKYWGWLLEENADGIHFSFSSLPLPFLRRIVWAWSSLLSALSLRQAFAEKLATKAWFVDLVNFSCFILNGQRMW